jgi:hypothetical protein
MTTETLTRTPALTVTLAANCSQAAWESALDWINSRGSTGAEPTFVDLGEQHVWLFAAA